MGTVTNIILQNTPISKPVQLKVATCGYLLRKLKRAVRKGERWAEVSFPFSETLPAAHGLLGLFRRVKVTPQLLEELRKWADSEGLTVAYFPAMYGPASLQLSWGKHPALRLLRELETL